MAEGFLRHHGGDRFDVYSAGTEPAERVHPLSVAVMGERGIDISGQEPRHVREYLGVVPVHFAIIVCAGANETCPTAWPGARERLFWPFEDPAAFEGGEDETLEKFRAVRDQIEAKIVDWLGSEAPNA